MAETESKRKYTVALVIRDQLGRFFEIPEDKLEQFRMTDEQVEAFLKSLQPTCSYPPCGYPWPVSPSAFVRAVPTTSASALWRYAPSSFARVVPSSFVRAVPSAVVRAVPSSMVRAVPSAVVRAVPSSMVRAVPSAVVRAVPSSMIRAVPSAVVRAVPSSVARITPGPVGFQQAGIGLPGVAPSVEHATGVQAVQSWIRSKES